MTALGISLPFLKHPYGELAVLAGEADAAGFDSIWDYEFFRNPFVLHGLCSRTTTRATLAIGLAAGVARSPFEMANAAADVDELSGGRALLGLSMGGGTWQDVFHGADASHPVARVREYVTAVRLAWDHLATGDDISFEGRYYRIGVPATNPWERRPLARPAIPIYIGGTRPRMMQLAGEIADGLLGVLFTPEYVAEQVRPNVERAGRAPDIAAYVICSPAEDRAVALRRARIQVANYALFAGGQAIIEHHGLQEDRDAVARAWRDHGPRGLERAASDALVATFSIAGTPDECRGQLPRFQAAIPHVILHTPYVPPLTGEESAQAFRAIVRTFARR